MTGTLNFLLAVFIALKLEALKYPLWRVTNFAISARQYFAGLYFRDFNRQIWKKGIKLGDLSVLNFSSCFETSQLFKISR